MKHYYDTVLQLKGTAGALAIPASGVNVTVNLQGTQTAATIYSDDGITTKPNPVGTDVNGRFDFYIANGRYDLVFSGSGITGFTQFNVEITDAMDTTTLGKTIIAFTANNTHSGSETFSGPVTFTGALSGTGLNSISGQFNVKTYGAVGGARIAQDCVTTANSPIVTSATANWQASDVGKIFLTTNVALNASNLTGVSSTTILSRQSATQVTLAVNAVNTTSVSYCAWATQDDTAAFQAAVAAASAPLTQIAISKGAGVLINGTRSGTVFAPADTYILSGNIINCIPNASGGLCPSFVGDGVDKTNFIFSPGMNSIFLQYSGANGVEIGKFSYTSMNATVGTNVSFMNLNVMQKLYLHDIASNSVVHVASGSGAQIFLSSSSGANNLIDNITMVGGTNSGPLMAFFSAGSGVAVRNTFLSNSGSYNLLVTNCPARTATDVPILFEGVLSDECGAAPCARIVNSGINWVGGGVFGEAGANGSMSVDGTSVAWLTDMNIGSFSTLNNNVALNIAAGGVVYATMCTIRGNGTSAAVSGTSTSVFNDIGGNQIQNCSSATCTNVTAAQYSTLGFTGGIVPSAGIQMPSNTCYPVQGNLLATAQNLCSFVLTKNQQITSLSAQSGGTTPANSSCATPPVITLSDGTRTATMTMTSGKTFWTSGVDANTNIPGQVFASGATLTVSIGANTCATPPSNVSVTYNLQSVLNP